MFNKAYVIVHESNWSWEIDEIVKVCLDKKRAKAIVKNLEGNCKIIEVPLDRVEFCNCERCEEKDTDDGNLARGIMGE